MNQLLKTTLSCVAGLAFCICAFAYGKDDAQAVVDKFYKCLGIIAEEHYSDANPNTMNSNNAEVEAVNLCFDTDINMPNEFYDFGFSENDAFIYASAYMKRLRQFATKNNNVHYTTARVKEVRALEEIKYKSGENSVNFYAIYVEKTISAGGVSKSYVDSVTVNVEGDVKITNVTNFTNGAGAGGSIIQLRAKAAELWANKRYQEAYDAYLAVLKKDPMQGDPYYRLALMCIKKKGVDGRFKNAKERNKQALKFLDKAYNNARINMDWDLMKKVENIKADTRYGFV